jgi:hypothetical protein
LILPTVVALLASIFSLQLIQLIWRRVYPPTAARLHQQALAVLQQQQPRNGTARCRKLLLSCLEEDPSYTPALFSLVALYIYRLSNSVAALQLLQSAVVNRTVNAEDGNVVALRLDAQALQAGTGIVMLQPLLQEERYLRLSIISSTATTVAVENRDRSNQRRQPTMTTTTTKSKTQ